MIQNTKETKGITTQDWGKRKADLSGFTNIWVKEKERLAFYTTKISVKRNFFSYHLGNK